MAGWARKRVLFSPRRFLFVCVVCLAPAPIVLALCHDSEQCTFIRHSTFISQVPRGGDSEKHNDLDADDDDDERTRFWSLSALFRLNANAKEDAASSSASSHLQRGNKRGGALAVRTSKSKTFVDVTPVSTASSRIIRDDVESFNQNDYEDKPMESFLDEETMKDLSDAIEFEEIEDIDAYEEIIGEDEDAIAGESTAMPERSTVSSASSQMHADEAEDDKKDDDIGEEVDADFSASTESELLEDIRREEPEQDSKDLAVQEDEIKGTAQDGTKYWWSNVWTEQISEQVSQREELVSEIMKEELVPENTKESDKDGVERSEVNRELEVTDHLTVEAAEIENQEQESIIKEEPSKELSVGIESLQYIGAKSSSAAAESKKALSLEPVEVAEMDVQVERPIKEDSPFVSSGYWGTIDRVVSLGLSDVNPSWKLSRRLRRVRKVTAHITGLHGLVSKKKRRTSFPENAIRPTTRKDSTLNDADLGMIQRRIAAIEIAKQNVAKRAAEKAQVLNKRRGLFRRRWRRDQIDDLDAAALAGSAGLDESKISTMYLELEQKSLEEQLEDKRRKERVQEIDRLIIKGQKALLDLQCEKDDLQRRPNPLFKYSTASDGKTTRRFNFPPQDLVNEYLDELFANGRLERMNHTDLWKNGAEFDDDEDESIGDDLFVPSADARKLYETRLRDEPSPKSSEAKSSTGNGGGGSWLLRQNIGKGGSLGEKLGETTETAAYKAVCSAVMSSLARTIAALHGINIMTHSDIRLYMEQSPDLPPVGKNVIPGSNSAQNYAQEAIMDAMRKGVAKRKKRGSRSRRLRVEEAFLQKDAVVETLLSHCQISAPLLKLFPLSWQRALLGNIITLIAAIVSDFCDGLQLQILGHQLSFAFKPITESDMIRHIGMAGTGFNHRRSRPEQFEAAVQATAEDVSENLQFLDRWHHRALGSGMLRAQIANLIARIVLTLADEVLSGARMDLWSAQASGPRILAGLEYRTAPEKADQTM